MFRCAEPWIGFDYVHYRSAESVDHRLIGRWGTHHFDVTETGGGQCVEEFGQCRSIAAHVIGGVDRDPAPRPRNEIQRANHGWSVPVGCDAV